MFNDPHDTSIRSKNFRKDIFIEKYLVEINDHLSKLRLEVDSVDCSYPIMYIVGLPRSGTTLLSQLMSKHFEVGYINNLVSRFWLNPIVGIRLSKSVLGNSAHDRISLESSYGVTRDPWDPHEFGYFWRHWLKLDGAASHNLSSDELKQVDRVGLANILDALVGEFQAPLLFKNIICGFQARFLEQVRPNSLFIMIERDPEAVARSLFNARKDRYGDPSVWWSLKPSTFPDLPLGLSPEAQIERQISDGKVEFERELAAQGVNSITVKYEELCDNPRDVLSKIADACKPLGGNLEVVGNPSKLYKR